MAEMAEERQYEEIEAPQQTSEAAETVQEVQSDDDGTMSLIAHLTELRSRLIGRATDAPEVIEQRLAKASYELTFADKFDHIVVNDDLATAEAETLKLVQDFLQQE